MTTATDRRLMRRHVTKAQSLGGKDRIARYVAGLGLDECVEILAASPIRQPSFARLRDECRIGPGRRRSFGKVNWTRTVEVLSGLKDRRTQPGLRK